ncbi:hypothetical protein CYMTET_53162 [Cymbomonas tetramitiformis]|uniref:Uncharacterized protein n=1 Tax=Cymbomonas tetramitiformis TaxID=36881 RepID=A0AAE0BHL7_9CHLO|nr:hypothetical protein CYMTET_53162 [Cymbomonas tetramitiformis]
MSPMPPAISSMPPAPGSGPLARHLQVAQWRLSSSEEGGSRREHQVSKEGTSGFLREVRVWPCMRQLATRRVDPPVCGLSERTFLGSWRVSPFLQGGSSAQPVSERVDLAANCGIEAMATDGSFLYAIDRWGRLLKIGTGFNGTTQRQLYCMQPLAKGDAPAAGVAPMGAAWVACVDGMVYCRATWLAPHALVAVDAQSLRVRMRWRDSSNGLLPTLLAEEGAVPVGDLDDGVPTVDTPEGVPSPGVSLPATSTRASPEKGPRPTWPYWGWWACWNGA